jgi:uncharacterized protein (TIGR00297 family)
MWISSNDLFTGGIVFLLIVFLAIVIEWACARLALSATNGRKLLHLGAISACAFAIHQFTNRLFLGYIFLVFAILLWIIVRKKWLRVGQTNSYGIALFPLAFGLLLLIPVISTAIIVFAVLTLGICDAAAGWAGERWSKKKHDFWKEPKSLLGLTVFWITNSLLYCFLSPELPVQVVIMAVTTATLPALTELFSWRGSDNLSVPLITAAWLLLLQQQPPTFFVTLLWAIPLLIVLAALTVHKRWLSVGGASAAVWMGIVYLVSVGWAGFIAPLLFLIAGSLLSRLNPATLEKHGREAAQVFANGLPGVLCYAIYAFSHQSVWLQAALLGFAIAICDSVSAEAGKYIGGKTIDISTLRPVLPGLSGGISLAGTVAGVLAALLLLLVCSTVFSIPLSQSILLCGFATAGMLLDSLLGSRLQVKYQDPDGQLTEIAVAGARHWSGRRWCGNDLVNFLAITLTVIAYLLVSWAFHYYAQ